MKCIEHKRIVDFLSEEVLLEEHHVTCFCNEECFITKKVLPNEKFELINELFQPRETKARYLS